MNESRQLVFLRFENSVATDMERNNYEGTMNTFVTALGIFYIILLVEKKCCPIITAEMFLFESKDIPEKKKETFGSS